MPQSHPEERDSETMVLVDLRTGHKLADRVHHYVRTAILEGELGPGSRIVEAHLAQQLGVSRSPVREAVSRLAQEGLVTVSGLRVTVRDMPAEEIRDLLWIRCALHGTAAALATPRLTAEDIHEMDRICDAMAEAATKQDSDAVAGFGEQFDAIFERACGNLRLQQILREVREYVGRFRRVSAAQPGRAPESAREHRELLAAFKSRDAAEAEKQARAHVLSVMRSLLESR